MDVTVTGATGTIGRALTAQLLRRGDRVTALTRDAQSARDPLDDAVDVVEWHDPAGEQCPSEALAGRDGVVNLIGEELAQRWTAGAKRRIRSSRVDATENLVAGLRAAQPRPQVLVSQSAVGWYGPRGDEAVDEREREPGEGFLAQLCADWEAAAQAAEELGLRVVRTRTGVVLSPHGGALSKMMLPFRLGLGGPVAGGGQYMPWIHVDDVVGTLLWCLDHGDASGPVNLTAPEPATNRELSKALGRALGRPALLPVPGFALRLLYGEMADVITTGQRVVPTRLRELGYDFAHADLDEALRAATKRE